MLLSTNHLRARHAVSKDDRRHTLTHIDVRVERDEVVAVATDGYCLIEVREETPHASEFPTQDSPAVDHIRITKKTADKLKPMMKGTDVLPILAFASATSEGVVTTDLERTIVFRDVQDDAPFPKYQELIPGLEKAVATVRLNPKRLADVLKAFDGLHSIDLVLNEGELAPVVLRSHDEEFDVTGVVLPLKA